MVAATDYMRAFADGIRPWVPRPYRVLGHRRLRAQRLAALAARFFEVDRRHVALAALTSLAEARARSSRGWPRKAIERYEIDTERPAPWKV